MFSVCLLLFLKEGTDGELWTVIGREFQILAEHFKVERSVFNRFKVSFGDFQQFFIAGPKSSRRLVGVKQF